MPFLRERANAEYRNHRYWTHADLGDLLPSDLLARHLLFCFHEDNFGLAVRHEVGIDRILSRGNLTIPMPIRPWPSSPEQLWASVKDYPREEIDKITHGNAMRFLNIDPFQHIDRKDATVGALRAKATHVNTELMSAGGLKPVKSGSVLSTADVYKMFQQGDARLGEPIGYL